MGQIIGLLVVVYIFIMTLLLIFVKEKEITSIVTRFFYEKTGQIIHIKGNISLSIFPWPAIRASNIIINNPKNFKAPPSFPYLAKISKVSARLRIISLFYGKIDLVNILLKKADVNFVITKKGSTNWNHVKNLKTKPGTASTQYIPTSSNMMSIKFPLIQISDSSIHFINLKTQSKTHITHIFLNSPNSYNSLGHQITGSAQIKNSDSKVSFDMQLDAHLTFDPKKSLITLSKIWFATKWYQIRYSFPYPIALIMRGNLTIHNRDFQSTLHGSFGESEGNIVVNTNHQKNQVNIGINMKDIYATPFIEILTGKKLIDGKLNFLAYFKIDDNKMNTWINHLNGQGHLKITNGKIKGFNISFLLLKKQSIYSALQKSPVTLFKTISTRFILNQGQLILNNFLLDSDMIKVTGKGIVNLPSIKINATLFVTYIRKLNWKIPVKITGPLFKPMIQPQINIGKHIYGSKKINNMLDNL